MRVNTSDLVWNPDVVVRTPGILRYKIGRVLLTGGQGNYSGSWARVRWDTGEIKDHNPESLRLIEDDPPPDPIIT